MYELTYNWFSVISTNQPMAQPTSVWVVLGLEGWRLVEKEEYYRGKSLISGDIDATKGVLAVVIEGQVDG